MANLILELKPCFGIGNQSLSIISNSESSYLEPLCCHKRQSTSPLYILQSEAIDRLFPELLIKKYLEL
jgi:hypothetical protein